MTTAYECGECGAAVNEAGQFCAKCQPPLMSGELDEENEHHQEAADARREAIEDPAIDPLDLKLEGDQGRLL